MKVLYTFIAVLSLPATLILSNWFWSRFRESRGIGLLLGSPELLQRFVTADVLQRPPAEVARFTQPLAGGYALNMRVFQQVDEWAHSRAWTILRPVLAAVVVGSGVVGFLGVGWLGLAFPVLNVLICNTTFVGSTQGSSIDNAAMARAVQHVQILAVILHRWYRNSPREATEWLKVRSEMKPLWELLAAPHVTVQATAQTETKPETRIAAKVESPMLQDVLVVEVPRADIEHDGWPQSWAALMARYPVRRVMRDKICELNVAWFRDGGHDRANLYQQAW